MSATATLDGKVISPPIVRLHISWPFNCYKPESEKAVRKLSAKGNILLEKFKGAFKAFELVRTGGFVITDNSYNAASSLVKDIKYFSKDVTAFSLALAELQDAEEFADRAGFFLSALVNNCSDREFTIITQHLVKPLNNFGFENIKNVTIYGDVGNSIGYNMKRGNITVKGNATDLAGAFMDGGALVVEGDAGDRVGEGMSDGAICLKGKYNSLCSVMVGGRIYHKRKLIVRNGLKLEGIRFYSGGKLIAENGKRVI